MGKRKSKQPANTKEDVKNISEEIPAKKVNECEQKIVVSDNGVNKENLTPSDNKKISKTDQVDEEEKENLNLKENEKSSSEETMDKHIDISVNLNTVNLLNACESTIQEQCIGEADVTDSQLCGIDEKENLFKDSKDCHFAKIENLGIVDNTVTLEGLLSNLVTLNQTILTAKKEIAMARLRYNKLR